MKRMLLLLPVLLLALLSGCGNDPEAMAMAAQDAHRDADDEIASSADVFSAQPEAASYPLSEDGASLTLYAALEETDADRALLDACEEETGVSINLCALPYDEYENDLNIAIEAGDPADLLLSAPEWMLDTDLCGDLLQLDDLIAEHAPNYIAAAKNCCEGLDALYDPEDGILQMYRLYESPQLIPSVGIAIRADWLDALGMDAPETYEDYHALLAAMKETYDPSLPLRMLPAGISGYDTLNAGYGISLGSGTAWYGFYQVDGQVRYGPLEEGFSEYVTMMHQWVEEDLITAKYLDYADMSSNSYLIELSTGDSGIFLLPLSSWSTLEGMCGYPITPGMDPVVNEGDSTHLAPSQAAGIYDSGFAVMEDCEDPELAVSVADWFYSDAAAEIGNYGTEGISYALEGDAPVYTELLTANPDGLSPREAAAQYTSDLQGIIADARVGLMLSDCSEILNVWTRQKDDRDMLPAGLQLTDEDAEDFSMIMAGIAGHADSVTAQLISGDKDLGEIADFQAELEEYGIQDAIDILQAALDESN